MARIAGLVVLLVGSGALFPGHGVAQAASDSDFLGCWANGAFFSPRTRTGTVGLFVDEERRPGPFEPATLEGYRSPFSNMPIKPRWSRIEGSDSIRMSIAYTGFNWTIIQATLKGDSLVGTYSDHSDGIPPTPPPKEPFVAWRAPCPDEWLTSR